MKLSRMFNSLPKRLAAAATLALAVMFPVATLAAETVKIEGAMGVANVTTGETTYKASTSATYDQVVKYQVYYHNTELPDSGKLANNLRVKITLPTAAGTTQTASATISADNSNTITDTTTVNLNRADATIQYIPGSAVWRHNTGTNEAPVWTESKISDAVVTSGTGVVLENEKPCYNYGATVTVLARVMVPGVQVTKQVRVKGQTTWATAITASAGQTVEYLITYKNTGNTEHKNVVVRDNMPPKVSYVAGTTWLKNSTNPNGVKYNSDAVVTNGIVVGNYQPGGVAYVWFDAKLPEASALTCGANKYRNVGVVKPEGMNEYYNSADVTVNKVCEQTPPPEEKKPVYSCDELTLTTGSNRAVTASVKYTAKDGAAFKTVTYNFGDGASSIFTTDQTTKSYQYTKDGTYTVTARVQFAVDGKTVYGADNEACSKQVTFTSPTAPPTVTPPTTTPQVLPVTGAGDVIATAAVVTLASALGYRLFLSRKLAQ